MPSYGYFEIRVPFVRLPLTIGHLSLVKSFKFKFFADVFLSLLFELSTLVSAIMQGNWIVTSRDITIFIQVRDINNEGKVTWNSRWWLPGIVLLKGKFFQWRNISVLHNPCKKIGPFGLWLYRVWCRKQGFYRFIPTHHCAETTIFSIFYTFPPILINV